NDLRNVHEYDEQVATLSQDVEFLKSRWLRSFTRNALWTLFSLPRTCTPNADLAQHYVVAQDAEGRQERVYFVANENETALDPREMESLRKIRSTFEAAYQITHERGIQFMVVFAPDTHRVYLGLPNIVEVSDAVRTWKLNDLPERIRTMVAEISPDILYLDLTPSLRAAAQRGIPVYLQDDTHWTVEGHRIAAEALHQSLAGRVQIATKQSNGESKKNLMVDLAQDAVMVRAPGGAIRYWNKGAEHLYGWASTETLGKSSHHLLKTVFPKPLASIEAELQKTGRWEGELVHERRDGSHVTVASRWELQRNGKDKSATVIEINREQAAKESSRQGTKDSVVDLAQDAVVVRTQDGTIRYWNKGAEHLYG
ncbi:MAG: PAS domain S-box protein, partial [Nitrospiraceae bacterium]